jgi:SsrA-binding protein
VWIYNGTSARIATAATAIHDPKRRRKLLLHRQEIKKLIGKTTERGMTIVPVRMYLKNGRVKVAISLARARRPTTSARHQTARDRSRNPRGGKGTKTLTVVH